MALSRRGALLLLGLASLLLLAHAADDWEGYDYDYGYDSDYYKEE
jgi:hypothetical protein